LPLKRLAGGFGLASQNMKSNVQMNPQIPLKFEGEEILEIFEKSVTDITWAVQHNKLCFSIF